MLAIRLTPEVEQRLDRLAKKTGRTKTFYAREAILRHLEDFEDIAAAEATLKAVASGREKTIPHAEILKRYGLEPGIRATGAKATRRTEPASSKQNPQVSGRKTRAA